MSRRRPRLWLPTVFVVGYVVLGWLIYQQLTGEPNTEALARIQPEQTLASKELPPEPQFTLAAIQDFDSVLERPLFSPSRRPAESAAAPSGSQDFDFTLTGVLIDIEARIALFSRAGGGVVRLAEGAEIAGWRLKEVAADFVVVEREGEERILELVFQSPPQPKRREN